MEENKLSLNRDFVKFSSGENYKVVGKKSEKMSDLFSGEENLGSWTDIQQRLKMENRFKGREKRFEDGKKTRKGF